MYESISNIIVTIIIFCYWFCRGRECCWTHQSYHEERYQKHLHSQHPKIGQPQSLYYRRIERKCCQGMLTMKGFNLELKNNHFSGMTWEFRTTIIWTQILFIRNVYVHVCLCINDCINVCMFECINCLYVQRRSTFEIFDTESDGAHGIYKETRILVTVIIMTSLLTSNIKQSNIMTNV
jgi:hypothetical protein